MSSVSSEEDVIRTRISSYEEDSTILYAYETNKDKLDEADTATACETIEKQESAPSETSHSGGQATVEDILRHCQVICDAIKDLDKKFDVIHKKVAKVHRCTKSVKQNNKPNKQSNKNNWQGTKKRKHKKIKTIPASLDHTLSYSPTFPGVKREGSSLPFFTDGSFHSGLASEPLFDMGGSSYTSDRKYQFNINPEFPQSPPLPSVYSAPSCRSFAADEPKPGPSAVPCPSSPRAHSASGTFSPLRAAGIPASEMTHDDNSMHSNPLFTSCPETVDTKTTGPVSLFFPNTLVSSSPKESVFFRLKEKPKNPSDWCVEDVLEFLKETDPQMAENISGVLYEHEIDGKALLLLKSDVMITYMGLKLGAAVKLCHYIERLKQNHYLGN